MNQERLAYIVDSLTEVKSIDSTTSPVVRLSFGRYMTGMQNKLTLTKAAQAMHAEFRDRSRLEDIEYALGEVLSGSELDVDISQMVLNIYEKLSKTEISLAIVPLRGVKFEGGILRLGRFIIINLHECDKESLINIDSRLQDFYELHPDEEIIAVFQYRGTRGYAAAAAVAATRQLVKMLSYYLALESTPTIPLPDSTLSFGIKDNETFIYCIGEDLVETNEAELQNYIPSLKIDRDLDDYFCTDLAFQIEEKSVKLEIEISFLKAYFWIAEAQRQRDNSSAFICFCIALEILLSPARNEHSPISRSIAERLAFLFGTNIESRKRIFSKAKFYMI
jgi:hypothetical protein